MSSISVGHKFLLSHMFDYILQTVETRLPQTMEQSHLQFLEIQKLVLLQLKLVNLVMISTVVQLTYLVM